MNKADKYKKAVIFTGGECDTALINFKDIIPHPSETLIIAADSGYRTSKKADVTPNLIIGDMDSVGFISETLLNSEKIEIITANPEKDYTDTMLAVDTAVSRGAEEITIIGGTGGRCDHALANIFLLEGISERGLRASMTDGRNYIRILKNSTLRLKKRGYRYFSLLSTDICTVTVSGCKYPLTDSTLKRTNPYSVSNEITGEEAAISVSGGSLIIIESENTANTL